MLCLEEIGSCLVVRLERERVRERENEGVMRK